MLLELARKTRHRHNKSGIKLSVGLVRCVTGESPNYLMPVMMVLRHSSIVLSKDVAKVSALGGCMAFLPESQKLT